MGLFGWNIITIDPGGFAYLWQAFLDMGPCQQTEMGTQPWDWTNVVTFAHQFLAPAEGWEIRTLRAMSEAYWSELRMTSPTLLSPVARAYGDGWTDFLPPDAEPGKPVLLSLPETDEP